MNTVEEMLRDMIDDTLIFGGCAKNGKDGKDGKEGSDGKEGGDSPEFASGDLTDIDVTDSF